MNRILHSPERPDYEPAQPPMIYVRKSPKWEYKVATHQLPSGAQADENEFASWRIIMAANFFVDVGLPEEGSQLLKIIEARI